MLLSRDAIGPAVETLSGDQFYVPAHGYIFDAIASLYGAGEPADPVTVAEELSRSGFRIEQNRRTATTLELQTGTPASSNAARYARIVEEHALLRRLIGVAGDIVELGYSHPEDVVETVDEAEAMMFQIAERRVVDSTKPIRELLDANLDRLEELYEQGNAITGLPTGYVDFDDLLSGLQPSNLVIVGARPSMGKKPFLVWEWQRALHLKLNDPSYSFHLEMGHLEPTQRLLCSDARVDSSE